MNLIEKSEKIIIFGIFLNLGTCATFGMKSGEMLRATIFQHIFPQFRKPLRHSGRWKFHEELEARAEQERIEFKRHEEDYFLLTFTFTYRISKLVL